MSQNPQPGYPVAQPLSPSDERLWATLIHVGGIFFGFIPALIGYLVLKDRSAFVRDHSRSALNFQITWVAVQIANLILGSILTVVTFGIWSIVQVLIALAGGVIVLIFSIMAAVAANRGAAYRYPLSIPFVK